MKVILIFAGASSRFHPLTEKSLWPLAGKTILEHQIERLKRAGCDDIFLVGNEKNIHAAKALGLSVGTFVTQTSEHCGMREGFLAALPLCGHDSVLLVNSNDIVAPSAYTALIHRMKTTEADAVLLAKKVQQYFPGGYLTVEGVRVTGIVEKPKPGQEPSDLVNIVAHVHRHADTLLAELLSTSGGGDDGYERTINRCCKAAHIEALPYDGAWQAIKYPWHLLSALPLLLQEMTGSHIARSADIHPSSVITGNVIIEDNVRVLPHATIVGPCTIGKGSIIGNNALVRESSLGDQCVIGYNTEITRSILHHRVWTHMSYVGDSVLDSDVSLGGGTTTGNLRLDEGEISSVVQSAAVRTGLHKFGTIIGAHTRTGIHCCLQPGVKIGAGCFLGSSTLIESDIPDHSFVQWKDRSLDIRVNRESEAGNVMREKFRKNLSSSYTG